MFTSYPQRCSHWRRLCRLWRQRLCRLCRLWRRRLCRLCRLWRQRLCRLCRLWRQRLCRLCRLWRQRSFNRPELRRRSTVSTRSTVPSARPHARRGPARPPASRINRLVAAVPPLALASGRLQPGLAPPQPRPAYTPGQFAPASLINLPRPVELAAALGEVAAAHDAATAAMVRRVR